MSDWFVNAPPSYAIPLDQKPVKAVGYSLAADSAATAMKLVNAYRKGWAWFDDFTTAKIAVVH